MRGLDTSHYQGKINWNKMKESDVQFIIQKCSQGTSYKDPTYEKNKAGTRSIGRIFSSYHFANGYDAVKEADWFVTSVGDIAVGDLLVLDYEIHLSNPAWWCKSFLDRVTEKVGFKPLIYINSSTASYHDWASVIEAGYQLWIANYGNNDGTQHANPGIGKWPSFLIHQYTSKGRINGIIGFVDINYTQLNVEKLRQHGKCGIAPPITEPKLSGYTIYSQKNLRWAWKKVGFGNQSFWSVGCFVCALATIVNKRPDKVNKLLKKAGAFNVNLIKSKEAASALGLEYLGKETNIENPPDWSPTIKEVRFGKNWQQHFVARIIKPDGGKAIIDPWGGVERKINYYELKCGTPNWEKEGFSYRKFRIIKSF